MQLTRSQPSENARKMLKDRRSSTRASASTSTRKPRTPPLNRNLPVTPTMTLSWQGFWEKSTPTSRHARPRTAKQSRAMTDARHECCHLLSRIKNAYHVVRSRPLKKSKFRPPLYLLLRTTTMPILPNRTMICL